MSPPTVRVNTFVEQNKQPHIDPISKTFIISEAIFGLNRMPLISKRKVYVFLTFTIFILMNIVTIFLTLQAASDSPINITMFAQITQNIFITFLSFTRCKCIESYYGELNKFDTEAGCMPKVSFGCIQNVVQANLTCIFIVMLFVLPVAMGILEYNPQQFIPMHIVYVLEVHYFGHLLNLITPRLKLINYCIQSSLLSDKSEPSTLIIQFVYFKSYDAKKGQCRNMKKIMDLYKIAVDAYDFLIEGLKWQLLVMMISAFVMVLGFLYFYSLQAIQTGKILTGAALHQILISLIIMIPLFSPCVFGDSVHNEVGKLRELLASKLHQNMLDKSGRSVARALLAFTETRALSFRLLRMLNIDISLPFKFVGLLVTYLIILLQFQKVLNP